MVWGYLFHKRVKGNKGKRGDAMQQDIEELAAIVIDCGYKLHLDLGPGLLVDRNKICRTAIKCSHQTDATLSAFFETALGAVN
jgi:hypothetical protein